jgi:hypothetical protein
MEKWPFLRTPGSSPEITRPPQTTIMADNRGWREQQNTLGTLSCAIFSTNTGKYYLRGPLCLSVRVRLPCTYNTARLPSYFFFWLTLFSLDGFLSRFSVHGFSIRCLWQETTWSKVNRETRSLLSLAERPKEAEISKTPYEARSGEAQSGELEARSGELEAQSGELEAQSGEPRGSDCRVSTLLYEYCTFKSVTYAALYSPNFTLDSTNIPAHHCHVSP